LDLLLAAERSGERRKMGSYFTPLSVARRLIHRGVAFLPSMADQALSVCDPACGGGAFLIEAVHALLTSRSANSDQAISDAKAHKHARRRIFDSIYGVDVSPLAVFVSEVALWLVIHDQEATLHRPEQFVCGDSLFDVWASGMCDEPVDPALVAMLEKEGKSAFSFRDTFPKVWRNRHGFDWIVGNPPWVAFQGRATQKISQSQRAYYRTRYAAFSGYPTLHALFLQRACELAPRGLVTLLLPSSLSDLDGYRSARARLRATHRPCGALEEFGQDAFANVVQPCFGLIAQPRGAVEEKHSQGSVSRGCESPLAELESTAPLLLAERKRAAAEVTASAPEFLKRFDAWPFLAKGTFGELGFQSNRAIVDGLFYRGDMPPEEFSVPLLEGRNVSEFHQNPPRLFMKPDQEFLQKHRGRLRPQEVYQRVRFVVRQTAAFTIAAMHGGMPFRNSLIAGYADEGCSPELLVGLLNSSFYRALHCSRQRDARQAAFPQVKLGHLRRLPRPPKSPQLETAIAALAAAAERSTKFDATQRQRLDELVFELFELSSPEREELLSYVGQVAPAALRQRS
jgi:hypothetical protein